MSWDPTRAQLAVFLYCNLPASERTGELGQKLLAAMKEPPLGYPCTPSQLPSARCQNPIVTNKA